MATTVTPPPEKLILTGISWETYDPPPELVIEVDITRSSVDKMAIYAAMGIREVWRHDGKALQIFALRGEGYAHRGKSDVLSPLAEDVASRFIEDSRSQPRSVWLSRVRDWASRHHQHER